jgi:hypothetical protein
VRRGSEPQRIVFTLDELRGEREEAHPGLELHDWITRAGHPERRQEPSQIGYRGQIFKGAESQIRDAGCLPAPVGELFIDVTVQCGVVRQNV